MPVSGDLANYAGHVVRHGCGEDVLQETREQDDQLDTESNVQNNCRQGLCLLSLAMQFEYLQRITLSNVTKSLGSYAPISHLNLHLI